MDLGNYELDTWLNWAEVVTQNQEVDAAIQILLQGLEFYPEEAAIQYKMAGLYLMANDPVKAQYRFRKALKKDMKMVEIFKEEFPSFYDSIWARNIIESVQKASD